MKSWDLPALRSWLTPNLNESGNYRHVHLTEESSSRAAGLEEFARLVREAHRDQRDRMEKLMSRSLDPLNPAAVQDPLAAVYPDDLDTITLQGYLGEVVAGLLAENFDPHGEEWVVPAFLFRNHSAGAQALERRRQLGGPARRAPGRTGDDMLAFQMDDAGHIRAWLFGEAKCTHTHDSGLISAGHAQFDLPVWLPVDLMELIEILERRAEHGDAQWVAALRELLLKDRSTAPPRSDFFVYVCGRKPKRKATWLSSSGAHSSYGAGNRLEAVEVHLDEFDAVLTAVYPAHTVNRPKRRRARATTGA